MNDRELADALQRVAEVLVAKPCTNWTVFFETNDLSGESGYTYRVGVSYCDTADQAIREATRYLPRFEVTEWGSPAVRIREAHAIRDSDITRFDITYFRETPQIEVR